jgi:hypothetical protein
MYFMAKSSLSWFSLAQHSFFSRNNYGKLNGIILSSGMHTSFNNTHRINSTFANASSTSLSILVIILQLTKVLYWKLMLLGTLENFGSFGLRSECWWWMQFSALQTVNCCFIRYISYIYILRFFKEIQCH